MIVLLAMSMKTFLLAKLIGYGIGAGIFLLWFLWRSLKIIREQYLKFRVDRLQAKLHNLKFEQFHTWNARFEYLQQRAAEGEDIDPESLEAFRQKIGDLGRELAFNQREEF